MFVKILFLAAAAAGFYAVMQAEPPAAYAVGVGGDSTQVTDVSLKARFTYSIGSVGSAIVGTSVRRSVDETDQSLADMKNAIAAAKGGDGVRARELARKITYMDSVAIENLQQGRPIKAMRQSMEAKSLLNAVRRNLNQGV
jgi:hypothetical protein